MNTINYDDIFRKIKVVFSHSIYSSCLIVKRSKKKAMNNNEDDFCLRPGIYYTTNFSGGRINSNPLQEMKFRSSKRETVTSVSSTRVGKQGGKHKQITII